MTRHGSRMRASLIAVLAAAACGRNVDPNVVRLDGRLEAPLVEVSPKVAGRVLDVRVREGDHVKAGDLLLRLDLGEVAIAVRGQESGLESAEARLRDLESGSRAAEIAAAEADVSDRQAALELARRELRSSWAFSK